MMLEREFTAYARAHKDLRVFVLKPSFPERRTYLVMMASDTSFSSKFPVKERFILSTRSPQRAYELLARLERIVFRIRKEERRGARHAEAGLIEISLRAWSGTSQGRRSDLFGEKRKKDVPDRRAKW